MKRCFQPVSPASMQTNMGDPGFTSQAANDLGNNGTSTDGWDSAFMQIASDVQAASDALAAMNLIFPDMNAPNDPVQSSAWNDAVSSFARIQTQADSMFAQTAQVLGQPAGTPTAPPIKAPVVSPIVTAGVHGGGPTGTSGGAGDEGPPTLGSTLAGQVGTNLGSLPPITHQPLGRL